jgi:hypothetical protein
MDGDRLIELVERRELDAALAQAVKRMEAIPIDSLRCTHLNSRTISEGVEAVRARLISAAKRKCQKCKGLGGITRRVDAPHVGAYHVACPDCQPAALPVTPNAAECGQCADKPLPATPTETV